MSEIDPRQPAELEDVQDAVGDDKSQIAESEEIRTLYITGLPHNIYERELYLIFGRCAGYQASSVFRQDSKPPVGFVLFVDQKSAVESREAMNGFVMDPVELASISIVMANKNMRPGGPRRDSKIRLDAPQGMNAYSNPLMPSFFSGGISEMQLAHQFAATGLNPNMGMSGVNIHSAQRGPVGVMSSLQGGSFSGNQMNMGHMSPTHSGHLPAYMVPKIGNNGKPLPVPGQPHGTLFIGGLGPLATEHELRSICAHIPGFRKLSFSQSMMGKPPQAFADFIDPETARTAIAILSSVNLPSTGRPLRVEMSKNPLGAPGAIVRAKILATGAGF